MNQPRRPFRINVGFLINQPIGFSRDFQFELEKFEFNNGNEVRDLEGTITLSRTQSGVQATSMITANTKLVCVRCLEEYQEDLRSDFSELFTFARNPLSEDEEMIPEDGYLDFENSINDFLFLEIPIKPICREDCKGLCNICGENLNETLCEHHQTE